MHATTAALSHLTLTTSPVQSVADVAVDQKANQSTICLRIKASKTDPFRQGCEVFMEMNCAQWLQFWHTYWLEVLSRVHCFSSPMGNH